MKQCEESFNSCQIIHEQYAEGEIYDDLDYLSTNSLSRIRPHSIEDWNHEDVMDWIIDLYENHSIKYIPINLHLLRNCNGSEFIELPEIKFIQIDNINGHWLYKQVQSLAHDKRISLKFADYVGQMTYIKNICLVDDNYTDLEKPRKRGRPKSINKIARNKEHKSQKVWEFLRDLLHDPQYCPSLICWDDYEQGIFRFVGSDQVAKIWGSKRGNELMNYEKLSRAMRYYYKKKILEPVYGKRLVYKFGPKATGWQTNNPNFEHK